MKFRELFRGKNNFENPKNVSQDIEISKDENIDMSRRNFLVGATAIAASQFVGEEAEAKGEKFFGEVEYIGFTPSKHEETLVKVNLQALAPEAVSVQISINAPDSTYGRDVATQNMRMSLIFKDGRTVDVIGSPVFHTPGENKNAKLISNLFEELRSNLRRSR